MRHIKLKHQICENVFLPTDVPPPPQEMVGHGYLMDETQTQSKIRDAIDTPTPALGSLNMFSYKHQGQYH